MKHSHHTTQRKSTQQHKAAGPEGTAMAPPASPIQFQQTHRSSLAPPVQRIPNQTGLSDTLKNGIESLSGTDISDVKVHYNSPKPAQLNAHAYAQGTDIHVATGQEKHVPHEAWHVVQQKQGRVQPTTSVNGAQVNDSPALEKEADVMGSRAVQGKFKSVPSLTSSHYSSRTYQLAGDKMALGMADPRLLNGRLRKLQNTMNGIYQIHKLNKKLARNRLDDDFAVATPNLEEKQAYLTAVIKREAFTAILKRAANEKTQRLLGEANQELQDTKLPQQYTQPLDREGKTIAESMMSKYISKYRNSNSKIRDKVEFEAKFYAKHSLADPIVQGYEKGYQKSGMNKSALIRDWKAAAISSGFVLRVKEERKDVERLMISVIPGLHEVHLATVYLNDERFVRDPESDVFLHDQVTGKFETREVFRHRESGKEYVQDANNIFVKRYMHRALNKYDNPKKSTDGVSIEADPREKKGTSQTWERIGKELVRSGTKKEQYEEIRNHQRKKEAQGGSPFISFTTTDHPIFGSSSALFESEHGIATVDMAQIAKSRTFDTHTPEAMEKIHGTRDPDPSMPFVEGNEDVERNSAARDAMRTREVVVAGSIPDRAIKKVHVKKPEPSKEPLPMIEWHPT